MNLRHGNLECLLYTDQFNSLRDLISYYLNYFLCININYTQGFLYMSSSFSTDVDEIILRLAARI